MAQLAVCPNCRRDLQVPDALLGQTVRCPTCAQTFVSSASGPGVPLSPPVAVPKPPPSRPVEPLPEVARRPREYEYRRRDVEPHRGTLLLVLGILSFFFFPLVLGPIAWIMGTIDIKKIRAGQMDPAGESNTNAGRICGMIATIYAFVILFLVAVMMAAFAFDAFTPTPINPRPMPPRFPPTAPVKPTAPAPRAPFDDDDEPFASESTRPAWPGC